MRAAAHILCLRRFAARRKKRMEKFIAGMVLGMAAGALLIAGNNKARALVKKGQEELKQRVDAYIDQKLADMEGGRQSAE